VSRLGEVTFIASYADYVKLIEKYITGILFISASSIQSSEIFKEVIRIFWHGLHLSSLVAVNQGLLGPLLSAFCFYSIDSSVANV
jgi:hypothetical protein